MTSWYASHPLLVLADSARPSRGLPSWSPYQNKGLLTALVPWRCCAPVRPYPLLLYDAMALLCVIFQAKFTLCLPHCQQCREHRKARKQGRFSGDLLGWVEFHHRQARPEMSRFILRFWKATQAHRWKGLRLASGPGGTAGS